MGFCLLKLKGDRPWERFGSPRWMVETTLASATASVGVRPQL